MKSICSCSLALVAGFIVLTVLISIATLPYTSSPKYWWSAIVIPHVCGIDPVTETRLFTIDGKYMNLSHDADVEWENLMMPDGGFITQPDSEGIMRKHGISMFHHLHCLIMIRAKIQRLMHLEQKHDARRGGEVEQIRETLSEEAHWTHCFDYIRQVRRPLLLSSQPGHEDSFSDMNDPGHPLRCRCYHRES